MFPITLTPKEILKGSGMVIVTQEVIYRPCFKSAVVLQFPIIHQVKVVTEKVTHGIFGFVSEYSIRKKTHLDLNQ